MESPRPPPISRANSSVLEARPVAHPLQSAQSSISSFTAYFGASTLNSEGTGKETMLQEHSFAEQESLVPLITRAFAPCVPVVASPDANELAKRKGFHSFFDMIRPFGDMIGSKVVYKDTNGLAAPLDNFNINFVELGLASNMINYGQVDIQRPGLVPPADIYAPGGDLVALERQIENEMQLAGENLAQSGQTDVDDSTSSASTYYKSFFQSLLSGLPTNSHETFSHPVAMCIAVSSQNQFPMATLSSLHEASKKNLPVWVDPDFLRYYVLIHDEDQDDLVRSNILYDEMRLLYGTHCYLLHTSSTKIEQNTERSLEVPTFERRSAPERLRSRWLGSGRTSSFLPNAVLEAESSNTRIRYLSLPDHTAISSLVREMVIRSIVPFMERSIATWNEEVAAPRRGLAGRFFKVGRSLWGSSSRAVTPVGNGNYDAHTSSYGPDTPEAQLRRLADYAFMLRDWKLANGVYDMLRKDFNNDKAWKHHAGAQEMFVVSLLLQSSTLSERTISETIAPILDSALYNYLPRSTAPYSAIRAMLLTAELLREKGPGSIDEAAKLIMRIMAEKIVGEMTRALLVDRVGFCFATGELHAVKVPPDVHAAALNYSGSRRRKAAFWKALAAESWSSIGKHRLARQALRESLKVYGNTEWIAIQGTLSTLKFDTGLSTTYNLTPSPRLENPETVTKAKDTVKQQDRSIPAKDGPAPQSLAAMKDAELHINETPEERSSDNQRHLDPEVKVLTDETESAAIEKKSPALRDAAEITSLANPAIALEDPPGDVVTTDSPMTDTSDDPNEDAIDALPNAIMEKLKLESQDPEALAEQSSKAIVDMRPFL